MIYDYQKPDPGWCGDRKRGASFGRPSDLPLDTHEPLTIRQVRLEDGYDPGGAYWGTPDDLFCVFDGDGRVRYVRAESYDAAKAQFPHAEFLIGDEASESDLADMLEAYITCALWSSNDESDDNGGQPMDSNYTSSDLTPEAREAMKEDVEAFARTHGATIIAAMRKKSSLDWSRAGHDLWLNRNGHGAGFWDGDWPKPEADVLDKAADDMGEVHLYVGDDGKIHA